MKTVEAERDGTSQDFDLDDFLPYLLNQAAEATSRSFQRIYAEKYGMTRTQWRVLANLGKFGAMTAKDICQVSHIEKTKVSRAITILEEANLLVRRVDSADRRAERLSLTPKGKRTFEDLGRSALDFDKALRASFGASDARKFESYLRALLTMHRRELEE